MSSKIFTQYLDVTSVADAIQITGKESNVALVLRKDRTNWAHRVDLSSLTENEQQELKLAICRNLLYSEYGVTKIMFTPDAWIKSRRVKSIRGVDVYKDSWLHDGFMVTTDNRCRVTKLKKNNKICRTNDLDKLKKFAEKFEA